MRKIRVGVLVAKRGAVTMTTVVQEVARVTRLGKDTPERHLSEKFNPEIKISYLHTHLNCMCVCAVCGYCLREQLERVVTVTRQFQ